MKPEVKNLVDKTKEALDAEHGTFEVIISTADIDRSGESILQEGCDATNYMKNPVVLFGHDYYSLPVGVCLTMELKDGKRIAKGRFAPGDANPFAQQVRKLYDAGIIRATSVGLIVKEMKGNVITKWELLEFSFVPVPANPYALSLSKAKELGLDLDILKVKGVVFKEEAPAAEEKPKEEKPAEVTPPAAEAAPSTEAKGAVADQVSAADNYEKKWQNLDKVIEVINAFFDVYLDENTPVENFNGLLAESAALLTGLAGGTAATASVKERIGKAKIHFTSRKKAMEEILQAVGAELTAMQSESATVLSDRSKNVIEILTKAGEAAEKTVKDGGVGNSAGAPVSEENGESSGSKPKVEAAGDASIVKEFNSTREVRDLLRAVVTAAGSSLEKINKFSKEKSARN